MIRLTGTIVDGLKHFRLRMTKYPEVFATATGEALFPGTLNLRVNIDVHPKEHFRILGANINEHHQDLLFEICRVNGIWAYRIRPLDLRSGGGGHGDSILELACATELRPVLEKASAIVVELFRPA